MRVFPYKLFFVGLLSTIVLLDSPFVLAAPSSVVRDGIVNEENGKIWGNGGTDVLIDSYFKWQHLDGAGSYVLRIKSINPKINPDEKLPDGSLKYPTKEAYLNAACTKSFLSDEDSIPIPSPGNPVLVWFLNLKTGIIQHADTYCWKVRADFEPDTVFSSTPWWTFSTELLPGPPPPPPGGGPPGDGPGGGDFGDLNPISSKTLAGLFDKIFSFLFGLAIFIVPVIVIYAAFLMLMGGGDPVKLQKGRMILFWTAVAFILILVSRGLPAVFRNLL